MAGTLKLVVEGWRFIPHSYAIVNQWQLLALLRRRDVELKVRDAPYCRPEWKPTRGIFREEDERALASIPVAAPDEDADAILRMGFPYEFRPGRAKKTGVFMVSEFQAIPASHFDRPPDFAALAREPGFRVITPSRWSAGACARFGLRSDQVQVVPHGVDPATFRPRAEERDSFRAKWKLDGFVFLSVGAMSPNKGLDHTLRAFVAVAQKRPEALLVLKGLDTVFTSNAFLQQSLAKLSPVERQTVLARMLYIGERFSMDEMAALYNAADVYLAPYRAEGFCLPVLEAAACGLPIICSSHGPTDEFVTDAFARKIRCTIDTVHYERIVGKQILPDLDHMIHLMLSTMDDAAGRAAAAQAGPRHAHAHYAWDRIVEDLIAVLR